jgi:hypothetical protein
MIVAEALQTDANLTYVFDELDQILRVRGV